MPSNVGACVDGVNCDVTVNSPDSLDAELFVVVSINEISRESMGGRTMMMSDKKKWFAFVFRRYAYISHVVHRRQKGDSRERENVKDDE